MSGWLVMVKCTSCFERSPSDSVDDSQRWPHDEILHAWWVEPGRLLAGEDPGAFTPAKGSEKLRLLVDAGVDSIVDLTTLTTTSSRTGRRWNSRRRTPVASSVTSPIPFRT